MPARERSCRVVKCAMDVTTTATVRLMRACSTVVESAVKHLSNAAMDKTITAMARLMRVYSTPVGVAANYLPNFAARTTAGMVWTTTATTSSMRAVCPFRAIAVMDDCVSPATTDPVTQRVEASAKAACAIASMTPGVPALVKCCPPSKSNVTMESMTTVMV